MSDEILPPEVFFKLCLVACPTFGFFVFAETAMPVNGAATLTAGFKKLFQAICVSLKFCCSLLFIYAPSSIY